MKTPKRAKKLFAVLSSILMLVQPILPVFPSLLHPVYAQEATASSEQTELTPSPTEEVSPTPTEKVTPTVEPTPTETPIPTETVEPTPLPEADPALAETSEPPKETGPPEQGQILDGVSTTPTPTVTVEEPAEEGQLQAVVLQNVEAESLNLDNVDPSNSATLTTDKADYAPTDTAVITGTGFTPGETYSLTISSYDQPPTSTTVEVTADENGSFVYAYQLDGTYRPNYKVEAKSNSVVIAETTFTDAPASGCTNDSGGLNDLPGANQQKDLTKMCVNYAGLPASMDVSWNWDNAAFSGGNTGDACSLFDTDGDGKANYAVCVQVGGNPGTYIAKYVYSCDDSSATNCLGNIAVPSPTSTCAAGVSASDPFPGGANYPNDTAANCTVQLSDVGGSSAVLTDVCSYPSASTPSSASDCILFRANAGKLTVTKVLSPTDDPGLFNLQIDGTSYATNVGNGGTTLTQSVSAGGHSIGEEAGTGTSLSNYTASVVCKNDHGTGSTVSTTGTNPWTLSVADESDILCIITNTRNQGTLRVIKTVINDNGGTATAAAFSFQVNGGTATSFEADGQNDLTVAPGTYTVTEPAVSGYATSYDNCTSVSVTNGGTTTCTITNNDIQPQLTVTKVVVNDNGGPRVVGDFPLFVDTTQVTSGVQNGFNIGTYTVSETGQTGYAATISGDCAVNGSVTLALGDVKYCTITNDDVAPTLTLVKTVTNNNGGNSVVSDFVLKIDGNTVTSGVAATVNAGAHTASEISLPGYTASAWGGDCVPDGTITLNPGDAKTCTITNDDQQAYVIVDKTVVNDNGGGASPNDFLLTVDGNPVSDGVAFAVNPGTHTAGETPLSGYTAGAWGGDCDTNAGVTVALGETKTCTITNDDQQGSIRIVKNTIGGDGEFDFTISGPSPSTPSVTTSGNTGTTGPIAVNAGSYSVSETVPDGWDLTGSTCDSGTPEGFTVVNNGTVTCIFTNTQSGSISGYKYEDADGDANTTGDQTVLSGWVIELWRWITDAFVNTGLTETTDGSGFFSFENVVPGLYQLREQLQTGWVKILPVGTGIDVTVDPGESDENNNFINTERIDVTVIKYHDHNADGVKDDGDEVLGGWEIWLGSAAQWTGDSGQVTFSDLLPGAYTLFEQISDGWYQSNIACDGEQGIDNDNDHAITLTSGNDRECFIGNYQKASISGQKFNDRNGNGTKDVGEPGLSGWTINLDVDADGSVDDSTTTDGSGNYSFTGLEPGDYRVREVGQTGWTQTTVDPSDITLSSGDSVSGVDFGNRGNLSILACKYEDLNGTAEGVSGPAVSGWSFTVDGVPQQTEENGCTVFENLTPGEYTASELPLPDGWFVADDSNGERTVILTNERETVNFYNYQKATITVVKDVVNPEGGDVDDTHEFTVELNGDDQQTIAEPLTQASYTVDPGIYTISELDDPEYEELGCRLPTGAPATDFAVGSNDEITITCTNQQMPANITVVKRVVGTDGSTDVSDTSTYFSFSFEDNNPSLTDDESFSDDVNPGEYFVSEEPDSNYDFLGCEGGIQFENGVFVSLGSGDQVTVTCTNTQKPGSISGYKWNDLDGNGQWDDGEEGLEDWTITLDGDSTQTDEAGYYEFTELNPATYTVCEELESGWAQTYPLDPTCYTIDVGSNETERGYDFGNQGRGNITVIKDVVPDDESLWFFDIYDDSSFFDQFSLADSGNQPYSDLPSGNFTITEEPSDLYTTTYDCGEKGSGESTRVNFDLNPGDDVTCAFTNTRNTGDLLVHKMVQSEVGGEFALSDPDDFMWGISDGDTPYEMGSTQTFDTGDYDVYENTVPDYHLVGWYVTQGEGSCENPDETSLPASVAVSNRERTDITICNARDTGTITVDKVTDPNESSQEFTIRLLQGETTIYDYILQDTTLPESQELPTGTYSLDELDVLGWDLTGATCTVNEGEPFTYTEGDFLELGYGDTITCTFTNTQRGTVIVTKYNDENGDGTRDEGEEVLSGWTMKLTEDFEETTGANGMATFQDLPAGEYTLTEVLQPGWEQKELRCGESRKNNGNFVLYPGETQECIVGNHQLNPILTISKSHPASDDTKNPGDSVTFTITVTATQSAAFNVAVTDLPAGGFKYRTGSWISSSTARGNLKALGITTEPTYASPGVWQLGDMPLNDTVTLTYVADINSDQKPGLYKDLTWAFGCKFETDCAVGNANSVLSNAVNPGFVDDNFVGTQVDVVKELQSGSTLNKTTGEVLGAATELPATGADELWIKLAALLLLVGLSFVAAGKYTRRFYV